MIRNVFHKYVNVESINVHHKIFQKQHGLNNQSFKKTPLRNVNASAKNLKRNVVVNSRVITKEISMFIKKGIMIHSQFKQYIKQISKENMYNKINLKERMVMEIQVFLIMVATLLLLQTHNTTLSILESQFKMITQLVQLIKYILFNQDHLLKVQQLIIQVIKEKQSKDRIQFNQIKYLNDLMFLLMEQLSITLIINMLLYKIMVVNVRVVVIV